MSDQTLQWQAIMRACVRVPSVNARVFAIGSGIVLPRRCVHEASDPFTAIRDTKVCKNAKSCIVYAHLFARLVRRGIREA
jgi:hypothetical protein